MAEEVLRLRATVVSEQALADIRKIGREIGLVQKTAGKGVAETNKQWETFGKTLKSVSGGFESALSTMGPWGVGVGAAAFAATKLVTSLGDISSKMVAMKYASRELGISEVALRSFREEAQKVGVAPEAMQAGLANFKKNTEDFKNHMGTLRGQLVAMGAGNVLAAITNAREEIDKLKVAFDFKEVLDKSDASGEKGRKFFEMLGLGSDAARLKWDDLVKSMNGKQPITDEQFAKAKAYNDQLIALGGTWDDLKTTFGTKLFASVGEDLRTLNLILDALNRMSNWEPPSWMSWVKGPSSLGDMQSRFGHQYGIDPLGIRAQRDREDRASEQKAIDDAKTDAERAAALKAQEAGRWRRAEDVVPAAPAGQSPEDKARLLQNQKVLQSVTPPTAPQIAEPEKKKSWREMLHLSAAEGGDDFHQYIQKSGFVSDAADKAGRKLGEWTTGGDELKPRGLGDMNWTGTAMKFAPPWARGVYNTLRPTPAEGGSLPEQYWPKSGPGVSKISFGGGGAMGGGGDESTQARVIRLGVFAALVDFKSYMQAAAGGGGGDGGGAGGMVSKASFSPGGGMGGGGGGGLAGGGSWGGLGGNSGSTGEGGQAADRPGTGGQGSRPSGSMVSGGGSGGTVPTTGGGSNPTLADMVADARARATAHGVDPDVATGIIMGESGLHKPGETRGAWGNNDPSRSGKPGTSYGAFQLRTPGLGSEFIKQTGLPLNASTWKEQQEFAISQMAKHGDKWTRGTWSSIPDAERRGTNVRAMGQKFMAQYGGSLPSVSADQPNGQATATPVKGAGGVSHLGTGTKLPPSLMQSMAYAGMKAGVRTNIAHGDEPGHKRHRAGADAGDVDLFDPETGRKLDARVPADKAKMAAYIEAAAASGSTGIGFGGEGGGYMGTSRLHIGQGTPAVWGAGGSTANTPRWVADAYKRGMANPVSGQQQAAALDAASKTSTARIDGAVGAQAASGSVNVTVNSNGTKATADAKTDGGLFQPPTIRQHKQMQRTEDAGVNV